MSITLKKSIVLSGDSLKAAQELISLSKTYAQKREEILRRYQIEMNDFAIQHTDRVGQLFSSLHASTNTKAEDGWVINAEDLDEIALEQEFSEQVLTLAPASNPQHIN